MISAAVIRSLFVFLALTLSAALPERASAQIAVDTELVLAVDVSGSVSGERFVLQRHGYAQAFRDPQVLSAIRAAGPNQAIAVAMFQWTGYRLQRQVIDWTIVKDEASATALADAIDAGPRQIFGGGTSLSGAIDNAVALFKRAPFKAARQVLDVSGDGSNNNGRPAAQARDEAVADGIVINGLPILTVEPGLDIWYRDNVIGGDGAFMISVNDVNAFADAIVKKLINEIASQRPHGRERHAALP
jgi:hypothetical protein